MYDDEAKKKRDKFLAMVERKAKEEVNKIRKPDGKPLNEGEKKRLVYHFRKRGEVYWTRYGEPPEEFPVELLVDGTSAGRRVALKIGNIVERERMEPDYVDDEPLPDLAFLLVVIGFAVVLMSFIIFVALYYLFA